MWLQIRLYISSFNRFHKYKYISLNFEWFRYYSIDVALSTLPQFSLPQFRRLDRSAVWISKCVRVSTVAENNFCLITLHSLILFLTSRFVRFRLTEVKFNCVSSWLGNERGYGTRDSCWRRRWQQMDDNCKNWLFSFNQSTRIEFRWNVTRILMLAYVVPEFNSNCSALVSNPFETFHFFKNFNWCVCFDQHQRFVEETKEREPEVLFVGDSLIAHLKYTEIWKTLFAPLHPVKNRLVCYCTVFLFFWKVNEQFFFSCSSTLAYLEMRRSTSFGDCPTENWTTSNLRFSFNIEWHFNFQSYHS